MGNLSKYNSKSERLDDASSFEERLKKFTKIGEMLQKENILIVDVSSHMIGLSDSSCGFTLGHGKMSWEIFRVVDVVDMIVTSRNDYIKRKENANLHATNASINSAERPDIR